MEGDMTMQARAEARNTAGKAHRKTMDAARATYQKAKDVAGRAYYEAIAPAGAARSGANRS